jgi:hypothetical protein
MAAGIFPRRGGARGRRRRRYLRRRYGARDAVRRGWPCESSSRRRLRRPCSQRIGAAAGTAKRITSRTTSPGSCPYRKIDPKRRRVQCTTAVLISTHGPGRIPGGHPRNGTSPSGQPTRRRRRPPPPPPPPTVPPAGTTAVTPTALVRRPRRRGARRFLLLLLLLPEEAGSGSFITPFGIPRRRRRMVADAEGDPNDSHEP